ncbi:MAG TPA: sigma-70 family RNA polymerase sigma factor [Myxococcota bacterium]|nr:sigma-70 family RNA polymerase sigma factor [Myxococcota bacterium]
MRGTPEWERDCVERGRRGDEDAFGELLATYQSRVFSLVARWVGRRDEAHELTQEAFLIAFREQERFDVTRPFRPWLLKIAVNVCRNHMRRHARREVPHSPEPVSQGLWQLAEPTPEASAAQRAEGRRLAAAMQELSTDDRTILLLRFREDLPYEELAVVLGRPQTLLKVRVHRALKRLRRMLEQEPAP